jgi:carbon-monoxide dehydrogenase medium subunit
VAEAATVLAERGDDASVLAGGQSLVPLLNMRLARPAVLVDINRVEGLDTVTVDATDGVRVGALVRAAALEGHGHARAALPVLSTAINHIGHPQIRNRTTIGGNIAHADPSSELPGVLACLDGSVELTSAEGTRTVGWSDFFVSVFTTRREPHELVTGVRFPALVGWGVDFVEMARRRGDFPIVALTVGVCVRGDELVALRVAATGVSDRPVRLTGVERAAAGRRVDTGLIGELTTLAAAECDPRGDVAGSAEYRRHLLATLLRRCLTSRFAEPSAVAA